MKPFTKTVRACTLAGAFGAFSAWGVAMATGTAPLAPATAQAEAAGAFDGAELERRFWVCDHAATRTQLDAGSAAVCSTVTEALRNWRFAGDFDAMLAWWRERKAAEHQALDAAAAAPARGPATQAVSTVIPTAALRTTPQPVARPLPAAALESSLTDPSPDALKRAYRYCDHLATTELFDTSAAAACSMVYEALKARVFGGSFERLLEWSRQRPEAGERAMRP